MIMMKKNDVNERVHDVASHIYKDIGRHHNPSVNIPLRSLNNVKYDSKDGYFELIGKMKKRTLTANTAKTFAQTLRLLSLSKELVKTDDIATKREAYYVSKNWAEARFLEQEESDTVMDDIEAMLQVNREQMGFIPEEKGGDIAGEITIIETDPDTGREVRHDCSKYVSGAYSVPSQVEDLGFDTSAKMVICIETAGMFQRLVKHKFWKQHKAILVSMGGVPTRATRRFVRRLSDEKNIPVFVFTDGDPYGWLNIYRTLKVGSGNAAHINEYFCVPKAKFFGITASDIIKYKLPTHPLKDVDIKRIQDGLKNDPFIKAFKPWQNELKELMKMKKRAEQQALATHGLNFVISDYLPDKIKDPKSWLP
jgi:DNA topoisomerase VI subunit A